MCSLLRLPHPLRRCRSRAGEARPAIRRGAGSSGGAAVCERRALLPPTVTAVAQGSPMGAQLFIWPHLPRAHLLPAILRLIHTSTAKARAIWHPALPLAVSSKTTSVNIVLREHAVIPTPPPEAMKIPDAFGFLGHSWKPPPGTSLHSRLKTNKGQEPEGSPVQTVG